VGAIIGVIERRVVIVLVFMFQPREGVSRDEPPILKPPTASSASLLGSPAALRMHAVATSAFSRIDADLSLYPRMIRSLPWFRSSVMKGKLPRSMPCQSSFRSLLPELKPSEMITGLTTFV
jgi:hypothetical protein